MSQNTVSTLRREVREEMSSAWQTESDLKHLDQSFGNTMDDRVGDSARQSMASIRHRFSSNINEGLKSTEQAAAALDAGYSKTDEFASQADGFLARAKSIVTGLGNL